MSCATAAATSSGWLSTEVVGGFTGRLVGVWAESRDVLVRRVRFAEQQA